MILSRSELDTGFKDKLFEINIDNTDAVDLKVLNNRLQCNLNSKKIKNGYLLKGYIVNNIIYNCDRCLDSFHKNNQISIELTLTKNIQNINSENYDFIYFSDKINEINIKYNVIEILLSEYPIKILCHDECEGLCLQCGKNLNKNKCSCKN